MKQASLKSFVKSKLNKYLSDNYPTVKRTKNNLFELSKEDFRLKILCASFYASQGKFKSAVKFNIKFVDMHSYLKSDDKYVIEYNDYLNLVKDSKKLYYKKLIELIEKYELSNYKIAKIANVSPINVYRYVNEKKLDNLSNEKIMQIISSVELHKNKH